MLVSHWPLNSAANALSLGLRLDIGFSPNTNLAAGIGNRVNWYKNYLNKIIYKMIKNTSFFVLAALLVVNLTDTPRVIALLSGLSGVTLVGLMAALMLLFLVLNYQVTVNAIRYKPLILVVLLLGSWPALTATYTIGESARAIGILVHNILLLICSFIVFTTASRKHSQSIFAIALIISAGGAIASILFPVVFLPLALEAGTMIEYEGRAFGFFLQPNTLGLSICFLMFCLNCTFQRQTIYVNSIWIIFFSILVLSTGSRFSIIIMTLMIVFVLMRGTTSGEVKRFSYLNFSKVALMLCVIWLFASLIFHLFGFDQLAEEGNAADRIRTMLQFEFFHSTDGDGRGTVSDRIGAQINYIEMIGNHPFLGYGIGSQTALLESGAIPLSAHSSILSYAFEYGIPYVILLVMGLSYLLWKRTARPSRSYHLKLVRMLFFAFLISFTANHGMIENRFFYVLLGFGLSVTYLNRLDLRAKRSGVLITELMPNYQL